MENNKNQYRMLKSHADLVSLLKYVQTQRINKGKETIDTKVSLTRLTKTVNNMIRANEELLKALIEVDIKDV